MLAIVTATYASLLALILCALSFNVVKYRRSESVGLGDGGNQSLQHAMRLQANFAEYAPMFLLLLLVMELNQAANTLLHVFGTFFVLSRVFHIFGFGQNSGYSHGRFFGTLGTFLTLIAMALANIFLLFNTL